MLNQLKRSFAACLLVAAVCLSAAPLQAQGRGNDKDKKDAPGKAQSDKGHDKGPPAKAQDRGNDKAKSHEWKKEEHSSSKSQSAKADKSDDKGNRNWKRSFSSGDARPSLREYVQSRRGGDRIAAGALTRAYARGLRDDDVVIVRSGDAVRLTNRNGLVLLDMTEERARNLGRWDVRPVDDRDNDSAPAFCRSGAGHPNWGRQWCIDKGFGLGNNRDLRWGRTDRLDNVIFQRVDTGDLARDALLGVLGNVVFDRLALHAVTLGYAEPLAGTWLPLEPTGPRVLQLTSGGYPVAEIVDANRDNRADVLVVALKPW